MHARGRLAALTLGAALGATSCGRVGYEIAGPAGDAGASSAVADGVSGRRDTGPGSDADAPPREAGSGGVAGGTAGGGTDAGVGVAGAWASSGTYTGDGAGSHAIAGLPFAPDVVLVRSMRGSDPTILRTRTMPPGRSREVSDFNAPFVTDGVRSFESAGFTVGGNERINLDGVTYHYLALRSVDGGLALGSSSGSGTRVVDGVGFAPDYVLVACEGRAPVHRTQQMPTTLAIASGADVPSAIASFDADGFALGSNGTVTGTCHWLAVRSRGGDVALGAYTGNRAPQTIRTGFAPEAVLLQCQATVAFPGAWRPASLGAADLTFRFSFSGPFAGGITAFRSDGFDLGPDTQTNGQDPCWWIAFAP